MTQITIERTKTRQFPGTQPTRFQVTESPIPAKPESGNCCPNCQQTIRTPATSFQHFRNAIGQLLASVVTILFSVFRFARLGVAMVLCMLGVVGFGLHRVAERIAHPQDRRLLPGSRPQNP